MILIEVTENNLVFAVKHLNYYKEVGECRVGYSHSETSYYIASFEIKKQFRNFGYGKEFLKQTIDYIGDNFFLLCGKHNEKAVRFYENCFGEGYGLQKSDENNEYWRFDYVWA